MSPSSCGHSGTIDMSVDRFKFSGKENLRGEGKINESSLLQQQAPMALNCAFPAAMDSDSSYSFSNYNHADQFQTGANNAAAGDSFGSNSTAMPRVVGWSNSSLFSRLGADDSSSFNDPMMALPGVESTKNYVSHALDSSFDSRLEASAIGNNLTAAESEGESVKSLRLQLQIRETQNESLESEIQKLRGSFNEALNFKQSEHKYDRQNSHAEKDPVEAPENAEQVFRRLSSSLRNKDDELAETKTALESILTALALDPTNSVTKYGRYDAEALAHKMVTRIETLTKENQEMAKMLAYGRAKEMQIQLQLAQMKNKELTKTISELKGPKDAKDANTE